MKDRQTGSVWTHFDGNVLTGPLADQGVRLEIQPMLQMTWGEWLAIHPDTRVLDWYPQFAQRYRDVDPGRGGLGPQFQQTILNWDDRLSENELVLGANVGDEYKAYVLEDFGPALAAIQDVLGGTSIVIFVHAESNYAMAFVAESDGFTPDGSFISDADGNSWDLTGAAVAGPRMGDSMKYITSFVTEWYGWAAYHPETMIFGR
jgi:hypothetical protein